MLLKAGTERAEITPPPIATLMGPMDGRGCTLDSYKISNLVKDRKSVILGVWVAPGAPETLAKGGGRSPPPLFCLESTAAQVTCPGWLGSAATALLRGGRKTIVNNK